MKTKVNQCLRKINKSNLKENTNSFENNIPTDSMKAHSMLKLEIFCIKNGKSISGLKVESVVNDIDDIDR